MGTTLTPCSEHPAVPTFVPQTSRREKLEDNIFDEEEHLADYEFLNGIIDSVCDVDGNSFTNNINIVISSDDFPVSLNLDAHSEGLGRVVKLIAKNFLIENIYKMNPKWFHKPEDCPP